MRKREMDNRVKLDPLIGELVRFKLHESPDMYEATILGFDETGYWVRGGSLCEYLKSCGTEDDANLRKAAKLRPDSIDAHGFLSDAYRELGQEASARRELSEAERIRSQGGSRLGTPTESSGELAKQH